MLGQRDDSHLLDLRALHGRLPSETLAHAVDDGLDHRRLELGVDRDRERLRCRALALRKVTLRIPPRREAVLEMHRLRVVDLRADLPVGEEGPELVAALDADDELIVDVP